MKSPQGALFTCRLPQQAPLTLRPGTLILDGLQDPGNVGTILRTADAWDRPVVLTTGCADPYSHKTVRASMGAVFRTPPQLAGHQAVAEACRAQGIPLVVTALTDTAEPIDRVDLSSATVVIGSEGRGVGAFFCERGEQSRGNPHEPPLRIPQRGGGSHCGSVADVSLRAGKGEAGCRSSGCGWQPERA